MGEPMVIAKFYLQSCPQEGTTIVFCYKPSTDGKGSISDMLLMEVV